MIKKYLFVFLFFLFSGLTAKANFVYDATCIDAYKAILSLRMNEARQLIQKEKQLNPQNGIVVLLENYIDYFSLLASENKNDYNRLKENKSNRVSVLEDNDKNSPYYLFSQAEIYLQWSFLKAKFGDYVSSGFDAKKANGLLKDNNKKYPDFLPNQKSLALVNIIFGSIPASFKGVTHFLGMNGNVLAGIKQLEDLKTQLPKSNYSFYDDEVIWFLCVTDINVLHSKDSYNKLMAYISGMDNNSMLKVYLEGYVSSKTAHNDETIRFLEAAPKSNQYINLPSINYMLGVAKLSHMDKDTPVFLNRYVNEYKGTSYIKDAYLKIAYHYLLQNDSEKYDYYLKLVRSRGYAIDGKDKIALREANEPKPDLDLLKARFYFDGGYYNKATAQLSNKDVNNIKLPRDKIEYYYRVGRIDDKINKNYEAVLNYQKAIALGKETSYYYAANAALLIGNIYEEIKDYKKAAIYYNQAIDMKSHDYQTDIDNDAKAGLKRIGQ
ncbi:lipopolysaccharide assembly protein LapB [Mucilaginibacter sp.]|uniref:tetratricopeptide repeat protein n=1 Tax=Mucilaginibacter sp. TaxID=1882438 RepID=UPI0026200FC6|nr:tetratricopeptide repeat protein [Mucilaginibacter sp.]